MDIATSELRVGQTRVMALPFVPADNGLLIPPLGDAVAPLHAKEAILSVAASATYRTLIEVLYTLG